MLHIEKKEDGFHLVAENGKDFGICEKKNYAKDSEFGYIWKLPDNDFGNTWLSAGKMKDGLSILEKPVVPGERNAKSEQKPSGFAQYLANLRANLNEEDAKMFSDLVEKAEKAIAKAYLEAQIAALQEKLAQL